MGRRLRLATVLLISILLLTRPTAASRLDEDLDFLDDYFATRTQNIDRICVGRMKSCMPWENECCEGLKCTNYGGRKCDYDSEMCVCFGRLER